MEIKRDVCNLFHRDTNIMARTRQLKHDFFLNADLAELDPMARLLFTGLWLLADREGRLPDDPRKIKAQIFPYHKADVDALLCALSGFVLRYEVDGDRFIEIPKFTKHQHIHPDEKQSVIPKYQGIPGDFKTHSEIMPLASSSSSSSTTTSTTNSLPAPRVKIPTLEEVRGYCSERSNKVDPQKWMDYYAARGWKYKAGQPMVDWKAAVRTWEKNDGFNSKGSGAINVRTQPTEGKYASLERKA